jgi:hypothetical protein
MCYVASCMDRIPPVGASSHASVRILPKSCVQQVKDICLFYVQKCSGRYGNNPAATRYIHHMAEEVISQLAGVAREIERNRSDPEAFQALLREWNNYFPSSLSQHTPKAIHHRLSSYEQAIEEWQQRYKELQALHDQQVSELLQSMEKQLNAYQQTVFLERHQAQVTSEELGCQTRDKLSQLQQEHVEGLAEMRRGWEQELAGQEQRRLDQLQSLQQAHEATCYRQEQAAAQHQALHTKQLELMEKKCVAMKDRFLRVGNKYRALVQQIVPDSEACKGMQSEIADEMRLVAEDSNDWILEAQDVSALQQVEDFLAHAQPAVPPAASELDSESKRGRVSSSGGGGAGAGGSMRRSSVLLRDMTSEYSDEKRERLRFEEAYLQTQAQIRALSKVLYIHIYLSPYLLCAGPHFVFW